MKATARAHPNLALVKYWGKRDEALILPHQSSLSMTLSPLSVRTTVAFGVGSSDEVELNGYVARGSERDRVLRVLDAVRAEAKDAKLGAARMVSR
ncbi:MAG: diphosphomevalonate decarboxylase, partial [Archangium sp.]